jgi:LPS sulfotransferase NodH
VAPHTALILCSIARTGSGLLSSALLRTRLAGKPDEYFGITRGRYAERWDAETPEEFVEAMLDYSTTPNGVFSAKIHWPHLGRAVESLRAWNGGALPDDPFSVLAPRVQYVWMRRRDKVRQAVSAVRAERSGFFSWPEGTERPELAEHPFDYEEIDRHVRLYTAWEDSWRRHFAALGLEPEVIVYEDDLEHGVERTTRRILDLLGVAVPAGLTIRSLYRKQSDELSEELVRRYREAASLRREPVAGTADPVQPARRS